MQTYLTLNSLAAFGIAAVSVAATAAAGSQYTQQSVRSPWYACVKPQFAPPPWVFPVVWTLLYAALTVAFGFSILRDTAAIVGLHVANLALNVVWCRAFFGQQNPVTALVVIVGNLGVAGLTAVLTGQRLVTALLVPYIAWLAFATLLNAAALHNSNTNKQCA